MMISGFNWPNLLALRVESLLLYSFIITILIFKEVNSSSGGVKSTDVGDIPSQSIPSRLARTFSPKNILELKCSKLNDEGYERVSLEAYASSDKLIQSYATITSISDADVTTRETTLDTISSSYSPASTNITNPEEVSSKIMIEEETTKAQAKTTIMTSNRETATQAAHLQERSHYQTLARGKSKNLVKLENGK